jgi:hypothetical protein
MTFLEALYQGDIRYEDAVCNIRRVVFVDRLAHGAYILNVYFGHVRYRTLISEHVLFSEMRRMGLPFVEGWTVYNVRSRSV